MAAASASQPAHDLCALELTDDVQFQLTQFKKLLADLQGALQAAAVQVPGPGELAKVAEPLQRAKLCLALAKAVNSLHHAYMRAHGRDPFTPSSVGGVAVGRQELDRIRQYDKKVSRAAAEAELRSSRPVLSLDVAAANRFIDAAIPDLTEQQRRDLKRAAQAMEAKRGGQPKGKKAREGGPSQQQQQQQKDKKLRRQQGQQQLSGKASGHDGREGRLGTAMEPGGGSGSEDSGAEAGDEAMAGSREEGRGQGAGQGEEAAGAREAAEQFLASFTV